MPNIGKIFLAKANRLTLFLRAIRPHQFAKNVLLFVPLLTAHQIFNLHLLSITLLGFVAFCLLAGATYIVNDLLDLEADRQHQSKKKRPFAAGDLTIASGFRFSAVLFVLVIALACILPWRFAGILALYFILTLSYSFYFKRAMLLDVCFLACLYTIRIIAGITLSHLYLSEWLLLFSVFIFLSLAFVKRYTELMLKSSQGKQQLSGRAYHINHLSILSIFGVVSGYLAALVLALYINSPAGMVLYKTPEYLWGLVLVLIYWISRIWVLAVDDQLHDDPVYFALQDKQSYVVLLLSLVLVVLAAI